MNNLLCDPSSDSFINFVNQDMLEDQERNSDTCESTGKGDGSFSADSPIPSKNSESSPPLWSSQLELNSTQNGINSDALNHSLLTNNWNSLYHMGLTDYVTPSTPINFLSSDCNPLDYFAFSNVLSASIPHPLMLDVPGVNNQMLSSSIYRDGSQASLDNDSSRSVSPKSQPKKRPREKKSSTSTSSSNRTYFPPPVVANIAPKPPSAPEIYVPNFGFKTPAVPTETFYAPKPPQKPAPRPEADLARTQAMNKRQERLIKNRAAALLSRKRKREQMQSLETTNEQLLKLNQQYLNRIAQLEGQLLFLGAIPLPPTQPSHTVDMSEIQSQPQKVESEQRKLKPMNTVFLILFFSLVLFSYQPSINKRSFDQMSPSDHQSQAMSTISYSQPSRQKSFQIRSSPKKDILALPEGDSHYSSQSENFQPAKSRGISPKLLPEQKVCTKELFDWLSRGLDNIKSPRQSANKANKTDLVAASSATDSAYVLINDLRYFISPQRFRSPNENDNSSKNNRNQSFPKFTLLTPWVEEPGSPSRNRLMKLDVQVTASNVIDSHPLFRYD